MSKTAPNFQELFAYVKELKQNNPEEYAKFNKQFQEAVLSEEELKEKKKKMKASILKYIKGRMNYLMGEAVKEFDADDDSSVKCVFVRQEEWDAEEFDTMLCSRCGDTEDDLNNHFGQYSFELETTMLHRSDAMGKDGLSTQWKVILRWTPVEINPFHHYHEEEEDIIHEEDDDDDDGEYHGYAFPKGTISHNTICSCDKPMKNDGKGGYYCDQCDDAPLKEDK